MTHDPLVNQWDLGNDPMKFAQERMLLAEELMKGLADRVVERAKVISVLAWLSPCSYGSMAMVPI